MNVRMILPLMTVLAIGVPVLTGCDETVKEEKKVEIKDDGTVKKSEEKVVREADGTIKKTEEKSVNVPNK
ncbi:MAG TPA: hypothetical protein VGQ99_11600 [Tepidisphaeraceae bacterium]|nr:hypothetical protein [Tepidisphaeraceae bacterium]